MIKDREIIVLCAGGHARVVLDIIKRSGQTVSALVDKDSSLHGTALDGVPIVGDDTAVVAKDPKSVVLVNALGNVPKTGNSDLARRRALFENFASRKFDFLSLQSPSSIVSDHVLLDAGCQIFPGAILNPGSIVGANTIINTGAQLDHNCTVGAHSHIGPGAILGGDVRAGEECHIGAGAVIVQGIEIGPGAVVGAGAVVVNPVLPGETVVGNPAKAVSS